MTYEVVRLARTGGRRMVVHQAAPGAPDEEATLRLEPADARPEPAPAGRPVPAAGPRPAGRLSARATVG